MHTDRLLVLAAHLENYVPQHAGKDAPAFDLRSWAGSTNADPGEDEDCGTVACAVGHACLIPEFNRAGLRLDKRIPVYTTVPTSENSDEYYVDGWVAVTEFFGLEYGQANYLFDAMYYPPAAQKDPFAVAGRIRALVAAGGDVEAAREAGQRKEVV